VAAETILYQERESHIDAAHVDGDELWVTLPELTAASGWELKPEGVCLEEICVPVPDARHRALIRKETSGTLFNLTEFARLIEAGRARQEERGLVFRPGKLGVEDSLDLNRGAGFLAARPEWPHAQFVGAPWPEALPSLLGFLVKLPV
jgi:hypothetical protein